MCLEMCKDDSDFVVLRVKRKKERTEKNKLIYLLNSKHLKNLSWQLEWTDRYVKEMRMNKKDIWNIFGFSHFIRKMKCMRQLDEIETSLSLLQQCTYFFFLFIRID